MSETLEAGVDWVNSYRHSSFTTPFGGRKDSGAGLEKEVEAIEQYLQNKRVWIRTDGSFSDLLYKLSHYLNCNLLVPALICRSMMAKLRAIVDEDIEPKSYVRECFGPILELTFGVEATEEALIEAIGDRSVVLATSRLPLTDRVIRTAPNLELIGKYGTGIDNIDLDVASASGVTVLHTPGLNAFAVAEFSITLILSVRRRLIQNQNLLQSGGWRDDVILAENLIGSTVGIIGYGNIGQHLARLLQGFDVDILAYDPYVPDPALARMGVNRVDLKTLLEQSDVISVNAELTEETRGLIDADAFHRMKEKAILVNTGRGPIVDQTALLDALDNELIAGAGLDVFADEPLPVDSPLHDFENVITTPHVAGTTEKSRRTCIEHLAKATEVFLTGGVPAEQYVAVNATNIS